VASRNCYAAEAGLFIRLCMISYTKCFRTVLMRPNPDLAQTRWSGGWMLNYSIYLFFIMFLVSHNDCWRSLALFQLMFIGYMKIAVCIITC
jgi:hypothetical protein